MEAQHRVGRLLLYCLELHGGVEELQLGRGSVTIVARQAQAAADPFETSLDADYRRPNELCFQSYRRIFTTSVYYVV